MRVWSLPRSRNRSARFFVSVARVPINSARAGADVRAPFLPVSERGANYPPRQNEPPTI